MPNYTNKAPYNYNEINLIKGAYNPSSIHTKNTALYNYYVKYLFQKLVSIFKFDGLPNWWAKNYFQYTLMGRGFIAVFEDPDYGVIPQQCAISDTISVFYQPTRVLIANPVLKTQELVIGTACELIKLMPDYSNPMDIVSYYADLMAVAMETASVNLLNSKASFIFFAPDQQTANTYKALYDEISAGQPFSVIDKNMAKNEDGTVNWEFFTQNVGQNYITDRVLHDMKTIEDQFNTKIGIPNANTQKRERLITNEVEANDVDTKALVNIWLETLKEDITKVNEHYDLDISVSYRYENSFKENREVTDGD